MRTALLIGSLFIFLRPFAQDGTPTNDSLIKYLSKLDLEDYNNKRSDSIIQQLPTKYTVDFKESKKIGYPYMAVLTFPDLPYLEVNFYYSGLQFTNPNGISRKKIARKIKKEKVEEIVIYSTAICVNGCG